VKWSREEYIELLTFGKVERQMFTELFGPLIGLEDEWRIQGASQDELNMIAFDWDYVLSMGCGGNTGIIGGFSEKIIEETKEHIISRDKYGRTMKLRKGFATIPLPLDYPVKTMDDWLKMKPMFEFREDRINWDEVERAKKAQKEGILIRGGIPGGFDLPRELMGEENACVCYYEDEELMMDILNTATDTSFKVLDRISDKIVIDQLSVHEDMAGKSGPLMGPNLILKYIKPYYRKVWDMLESKGTKIFSQDSDGNMNPVINAFLECGLNQMYPMEPAAGMDIVEVRKKYGNKLSLKGGIDKHVLRMSKEDIKRELEYKMQPLMQEGGVVFGLDHRIPNGTPIENYRYYVELGRELLGLPPLDKNKKGWGRMAF
jgi:uroporphyrinogen-III decarboxylase